MRREALQQNRTYAIYAVLSNECCDVGLSELEAMSVLAGPRLRAGDGQAGSYRFVRPISTDKRPCIDWSGQLPGGRQPLPNRVTSEFPVTRSESGLGTSTLTPTHIKSFFHREHNVLDTVSWTLNPSAEIVWKATDGSESTAKNQGCSARRYQRCR